MSIDTSLKVSSSMSQHRNVLTRAERIEKLTGEGKFDAESNTPTGLVKVVNRKVTAGKKVKKRGPEEAATESDDASS